MNSGGTRRSKPGSRGNTCPSQRKTGSMPQICLLTVAKIPFFPLETPRQKSREREREIKINFFRNGRGAVASGGDRSSIHWKDMADRPQPGRGQRVRRSGRAAARRETDGPEHDSGAESVPGQRGRAKRFGWSGGQIGPFW